MAAPRMKAVRAAAVFVAVVSVAAMAACWPAGAAHGNGGDKGISTAEPRSAEGPPHEAQPYLRELIARARQHRLWERRYWHVLLHYKADSLGGGVTSEADGPGFFMAPEGQTGPQAELEATLAGFFSRTILPPGGMTTQCTFVARYAWLEETLEFDPAHLPREPCERFEAWRGGIDAGSVTVVYASYFLNNPASMFGHTFLRMDKKGRAESQRLLDYSISYGAVVPEDVNGFMFALNGLFGGYEGTFSILPYYVKVKEYNDIDNRDLWEYRLNLDDAQVARLMRHTWEMGSTYYDYFFFKENCSYHILSLIEAADPTLHLTDEFGLWTLPTNTIRALLAAPGLVDTVTYRPSRTSQMEQKLRTLNARQRVMVYDIIADPRAAEAPPVQELPLYERSLVLESAVDFHQLELNAGEEAPRRKAAMRQLLLARSRMGYRRPEPQHRPRPPAPESGHGTSRVFLGGGGDNGGRTFYEVSAQPAFHDLLAREQGYAENSQINVLKLTLRFATEEEQARVERLDLVDIVSLFPVKPVTRQFSWKVRAGWERARDLDCDPCTPFVLDGGIGLASETAAWRREIYFAFLESAVQIGGAFDRGYRAGVGASVGALADFSPDWRVALSGGQTVYLAGDGRAVVHRAALRQRYSLGQNLDLRLDWTGVDRRREFVFGMSLYF
ncbi:MAG: DUF4105 domain-containing protein [SAR324 cluster bacterium]|nr:DUF4105 domain-containing protein [SAR324 cluster bacterium]